MIDPLRYVIGDTQPDLDFTLERDGEPLSDVTAVVFKLRKLNSSVVSRDLTLADAPTQRWTGNFAVGDLDQSGAMTGELIATLSDGSTVHGQDTIPVYVRPEYVESQV